MKKIQVLTLVGGISRDSLNKAYYEAIKKLNLENFEFNSFDISKLPYFSQDIENDPPDSVTQFKEHIRESAAVLFITPEYNRSFPGVLKNAIDWGSRPYGQNLWDAKPAAILGASPGNIGTFGAQHHLRQVLAYLNMHVVGQPEVYLKSSGTLSEQGHFTNDKTKELLVSFFDTFYGLYELVSSEENTEQPGNLSQREEKNQQLSH